MKQIKCYMGFTDGIPHFWDSTGRADVYKTRKELKEYYEDIRKVTITYYEYADAMLAERNK